MLLACGQARAADKYRWKAVTEAQVKIDDKIPLTWNIYQPDKKKDANLVLVLLGHRWLMLDTKAKLVYQVPLPASAGPRARITKRDDLAKPDTVRSEQQIGPTATWARRKTFTSRLAITDESSKWNCRT